MGTTYYFLIMSCLHIICLGGKNSFSFRTWILLRQKLDMASRKRSSTCARCMSLLWRPASQTRGSWQERSAKKTRCYGNRKSLPKCWTFAALSVHNHNIFELAVCMFAYMHACWLAFIRKISTYNIRAHDTHGGTVPYHTTIPYHALPWHTIPYYHTIPCHAIPSHTYAYARAHVRTRTIPRKRTHARKCMCADILHSNRPYVWQQSDFQFT